MSTYTIAELVRMQRQSIAENNSVARYEMAQSQLGLAVARMKQDVRPPTNNPMTIAEQARLQRAATLQGLAEVERQKRNPCPTGYQRNASGECVVVVTTVPSILPQRTEFMGPTISYNREPTTFQQMRTRPTQLPGEAYSTMLAGGLGYGPGPGRSTMTCTEALRRAKELRAKIDGNCALIKMDGGRLFDLAMANKAIDALLRSCSTGYAIDGLGASNIDPRAVLAARGKAAGSSYRKSLMTSTGSQKREVRADRDLVLRLVSAETRYAKMEQAYPAARGACSSWTPTPGTGVQQPQATVDTTTGTSAPTQPAAPVVSNDGSVPAASATTPTTTTIAPITVNVTVPDTRGGGGGALAPPPETSQDEESEKKPFYKSPWLILVVGMGAAYYYMKQK